MSPKGLVALNERRADPYPSEADATEAVGTDDSSAGADLFPVGLWPETLELPGHVTRDVKP